MVRQGALVVAMALGLSHVLAAQERVLRGIVRDSAGKPVPSADVGIVNARKLTRTDDSGHFAIRNLRGDTMDVTVRRIGYHPLRVTTTAHVADELLTVTLQANPAALAAVNVRSRQHRVREGIEDFHRRRISGVGVYVTRDEILGQNTIKTSDVLRGVPGIRFVRTGAGLGIRFNSSAIMRRDCIPMIWLDGQSAPGFEIDDVSALDIEGIELYNGPSTTPLQFSQASSTSTCGTIVVWTRQPGS